MIVQESADGRMLNGEVLTMIVDRMQVDGYCLIRQAVDHRTLSSLRAECEAAFVNDDCERARSSRGHVFAARNLLDVVPSVHSFWQTGQLRELLDLLLGHRFGLVRVLFFDKPPDRTWALPWHKDMTIAVKAHVHADSTGSFSRPTVKAGVPHVVACEEVLKRMLTLRIHLDDVTDENGPLRVIPGSHLSSTAEGIGAHQAQTIYATAGDVLAMRPLISHCSGASSPDTQRHRRILHLEFSPHHRPSNELEWHDFVPALEPD